MTSWYERCIQAFAARDYPSSSRLILERWRSGVPVECGLWLLIAAQRLRHPSAVALRGELLAQTSGRPHERAFVLAAWGELGAEEADIYRTDRRRSCAMDYYLGAGLLTKGNMGSAQRLFGLAATTGENGQPERFLALHELASPAPFGLSEVENVRRLCASAVDLHNRGFYMAAVETIEEARTSVAGVTSALAGEYCSLLRIAATCRTSNRDLAGGRRAYEELLSVAAEVSGNEAASAYIGLARLDFAARDYAGAARGFAEVLGSAGPQNDRPALEQEERCLRILASAPVAVDAAERAAALEQLAGIYVSLGATGLAERAMAFLRAQRRLGADSDTDLDLRLGGLYTKGGWYRDAIEPTEAVYADLRRHLGDEHPMVDRIRENLIVLHAALRDRSAVRRHVAQALDVGRAALAGRHLSGDDFGLRLSVAYTLGLLGLVVSLSTNRHMADPELQAAAALAVVERKGVTLEQTARARLAAFAATSDQQRLRRRVREYRTELVGQVVATAPTEADAIAVAGRRPQDIAMRLMDAERSLGTAALARASAPLSLADLTSALAPDVCLVEFVLYRRFDVDRAQQVAADSQDPTSEGFFQKSGFYTLVPYVHADWFAGHEDGVHPEDRYAAVVLTRDRGPAVIDIADARSLDGLVEEAVREITDPLGRLEDTAGLASADRLARALIDPLWEMIRGYNHVLVSPDASLCRVPFEILRSPGGELLLDTHLVSYAASARGIRYWGRAPAASGPPVVYGDPDFGAPASGRRRAVRFRPLPATRTEAQAVARELGVTALLGADACKDRIVECRSPRVLHIASHAFSVADIHQLLGAERGTLPKIVTDDPMLRSGIALSGANDTLAGTAGPEGVLFAHEVLDLDLVGTELVVLSSCDSGLGQVSAWHGVYGLRRAFSIAGARSQLMSLWQVPSTETAELMTTFYRLLSQGAGRAAALARAKAAVRREKPHPYYWSGFILEGVPDPLAL